MAKKNVNESIRWHQHGIAKSGQMLAILGFVFSITLVIMVAYMAAYAGRIVPGVKVAGMDVGNQSGEMAAKAIQERLDDQGLAELVISSSNREWIVDPENVGAEVDIPSTINSAWLIARTGSILERFGQAQRSYFNGEDLPLVVRVNEDKWNAMVASVSGSIDDDEIRPSFSVVSKNGVRSVDFEKGKDGVRVDKEKLKNLVVEQWSRVRAGNIEIPIERIVVTVGNEQVEISRKLAESLLNKKLVVKIDKDQWVLADEELVEIVSARGVGADIDKVSDKVAVFAEGVDRLPQNATFVFEGGKVREFTPGRDGLSVRQDELAQMIARVVMDFGETDVREITTPVDRESPAISTSEVNNMGINELIGVGRSTYFHSIPNRVHNVGLAAKRISGVLVAPGEIFSFNQALGDVSQATGYKTAYVISNGRTVLGDGGGVCQVSTTLFRAIMDAGLPVVERKAHSYRVSYYEQDTAPGIDATVYSPTVDLKFRNDTPGHLLIQTIVDEPNRSLRFEIYGTSDGRKSYVSEPKVWGQSAPPPPLYQDDPTLPLGRVTQIDWAAWGAKASFEYKVTRDGEVLQDEVFYSNYRPWQAVYLRGTKTD